MDHVLKHMRNANGLVQRASPYLLLEVLLPGGTLLALLLFLVRRARALRQRPAVRDGLEPLGICADC